MEDEMELMELWIDEVQGFDKIKAWHNDFVSLQKSIMIEGWLALVDGQNNADSLAAASSLEELVNVLPLLLMMVTTLGWIGNPPVITAAAPLFLVPPSPSGSIGVDDAISLVQANDGETASSF